MVDTNRLSQYYHDIPVFSYKLYISGMRESNVNVLAFIVLTDPALCDLNLQII